MVEIIVSACEMQILGRIIFIDRR